MTDTDMQRRVDTIDRLLPRLSGESHERLQRERLALLRRIHKVPQMARLPLDWRP